MKIKIKTDSINVHVYGDYYHPDIIYGIEEEELLRIKRIKISSHDDLDNDDIYDVDLQELNFLKNLKSLTIEGLGIDLKEFIDIMDLPNLTELCFIDVKFNIPSKEKFECKGLKKLNFSECKNTNNIIVNNVIYLKLIGDIKLLKAENIKMLDLSMYNLESNIFEINNVDIIKVSKNITNENITKLSEKCNNVQKVSSSIDIFKLYKLFGSIYSNFTIEDDNINQNDFEELIEIGKKHKYPLEALYRVALYYSDTNMKFDSIETYMIEKLNDEYLLKLYSVSGEKQLSCKKHLKN